MRKKLFVTILLIMILAVSGCSNGQAGLSLLDDSQAEEESGIAETDNKLDIALVMKTLTNPFFIEMEKGAREAEEEFNVNLIVKTGAQETSIDQQISIVEDLIVEQVDAIVIAPGGSTELVPVLKKAQDAGIVIVNIDNQLDTDLSQKMGLIDVPFISVDNAEGAYLSAKQIGDLLTEPSTVAVIEGISSAKNSQDRKKGALKAFGENPNVAKIINATANWKIDEAYEVTKKMLGENPEIKAIFCANDMMALGAIQYLEESNHEGILVAGFDALTEAKEAIANETLTVTIDQQASVQGYEGVKCAIDLVNKKSVELLQIIDVKVITKETL